MLRITQSNSAEGATKYFDEGLSKSDYYAEKGEIIGKWKGRAAQHLGLSGEVSRDEFHALCYNINPSDGTQLTARNVANRRVGYDFTFSVPKSISIVYSQNKDKDILEAFDSAIEATMKEIETNMQTRVRIGGKSEDRITGNLVYGTFTHEDARPVDGIPDPHLHQHVFVFNATYDKKEEKWKAGQFGNIKADGQYYETVFNSRLAYGLSKVGYNIERTKNGFELEGFKRSTIEKYSNRTKQVKQAILDLGLTSDKQKDQIGAKTRASKRKGLDREALQQERKYRLSPEELELVFGAKNSNNSSSGKNGFGSLGKGQEKVTPDKALDHAINHSLERKSVVGRKELLIHALERSYGDTIPEHINQSIQERSDLISKITPSDRVFTTKEALLEEKKLVSATRNGKGVLKAINATYSIENELLTKEQSRAVNHALRSKDFITAIAGGAGTGKTWSIKEVAEGARQSGTSFWAFAPSASASRGVQREDGFQNATTIAALLQSKKLQELTKDGIIWLDEAGMVGNKTMNQVIAVAKEQNARILLTGDIKQHGAVQRGDAMRIMQKYGGLEPAYISKIQRQKVAHYKRAIRQLSNGDMEKGYEALNAMGAIKENEDLGDNLKALSKEYITATKAKESVLIVSTTHKQGKLITEALRAELKTQGVLEKKDATFKVQKNLSYTDAQKQDNQNYEVGMTVQFHQNMKGFERGGKYSVIGKDKNQNILVRAIKNDAVEKKNGVAQSKALVLPIHQAKKFSVYENHNLALAKGDKIRITQNGFSNEKKRLNNGKVLEVKGFTKDGNIQVSTGKNNLVLDKNYRNFTHGYYTTSPASQGKSVNRVLVMQSAASGRASNKEQFYVSASRGKFAISIYTDDKKTLLNTIQRSSARISAMEMTGAKTDEIVSIKDKLKKINQIAKVGLSKASNMWKKGKEMMNFDVKQARPKPIKYAPIKGK